MVSINVLKAYSRSGLVSTGMSDVFHGLHSRPHSWFLTSHPDQLSLAISPWVGAIYQQKLGSYQARSV